MAIDRQGNGLAIVRIALGVFYTFEGFGKYRWFTDTSILTGRLNEWLQSAPPGAASRWYLEHFALPYVHILARVVPLGEFCSGLSLIIGFWTPFWALIAFFMALNFHVASGAIMHFSFLTNGYGPPVLGSTLGLAIGGVRLPWSIRR